MLTGVVINDYHHHLKGEGGGVFIKELHDSHAYNDCNKQKSDSNVLRIHMYSARHKRKPRLHDGTVTVDMDKYRLVGIPPSCRELPDVGLTRIR